MKTKFSAHERTMLLGLADIAFSLRDAGKSAFTQVFDNLKNSRPLTRKTKLAIDKLLEVYPTEATTEAWRKMAMELLRRGDDISEMMGGAVAIRVHEEDQMRATRS